MRLIKGRAQMFVATRYATQKKVEHKFFKGAEMCYLIAKDRDALAVLH